MKTPRHPQASDSVLGREARLCRNLAPTPENWHFMQIQNENLRKQNSALMHYILRAPNPHVWNAQKMTYQFGQNRWNAMTMGGNFPIASPYAGGLQPFPPSPNLFLKQQQEQWQQFQKMNSLQNLGPMAVQASQMMVYQPFRAPPQGLGVPPPQPPVPVPGAFFDPVSNGFLPADSLPPGAPLPGSQPPGAEVASLGYVPPSTGMAIAKKGAAYAQYMGVVGMNENYTGMPGTEKSAYDKTASETKTKDELAKLDGGLKKSQDELTKLSARLKELEEQEEKDLKGSGDYEKLAADLDAAIKKAEGEIGELAGREAKLAKESADLAKLVDDRAAEAKKKGIAWAEELKKFGEGSDDFKKLAETITNFQKKLDADQAETKARIAKIKIDMAELSAGAKKAKLEIETLRNQLKKARADYDVANGSLKSTRTQLEAIRTQFKKLQATIKSLGGTA